MEIMKVFSSFDNEDERLYSVLMDEYELALFSEVKEAENKGLSTGAKVGIGLAGAAALGAGGYYGRKYLKARAAKAAHAAAEKVVNKNMKLRQNTGNMVGKAIKEGKLNGKAATKKEILDFYEPEINKAAGVKTHEMGLYAPKGGKTGRVGVIKSEINKIMKKNPGMSKDEARQLFKEELAKKNLRMYSRNFL